MGARLGLRGSGSTVGTCSSLAVNRGLQGLAGSAEVPPTLPVKEALYVQSEGLCLLEPAASGVSNAN